MQTWLYRFAVVKMSQDIEHVHMQAPQIRLILSMHTSQKCEATAKHITSIELESGQRATCSAVRVLGCAKHTKDFITGDAFTAPKASNSAR